MSSFWEEVTWKALDSEKIITLFLKDFSSALKPFDGSLTNDILKYAASLLTTGTYSNLKFIVDIFAKQADKTIQEQFDLINAAIKRLNKKIVVYIDDVCRLPNFSTVQK